MTTLNGIEIHQMKINHAENTLSRKKQPLDFHPAEFPEVVKELKTLKDQLRNFQQPDNDVVIISFAKDHLLRSRLANSHSELVKILTRKGACEHLENAFMVSDGNTLFRTSLENYLSKEIKLPYDG
jgi:hypothetical protein